MCRDGRGRLFVLRDPYGRALLPGGPVAHGEHPAEAVARWATEQTAAEAAVRAPLRVVTDLSRDRRGRWAGPWLHRDTIVFAAEFVPAPAAGVWVTEDELAMLPMAPPTAAAVGLPAEPAGARRPPRGVSWAAVPARGGRRQRFAAYGHVTDPDGNVLLTQVATGFPGADRWHLPGGGTDFGESAEAGLLREITEETAQEGEIGALLRVSHRHQTRGFDGKPVDWHGVRAVYAVRVARPSTPAVLERGGSTAAAAWFSAAAALELSLTEVAFEALTSD